MARASARVRNPAGHAGLIDNAIGLVSALFAYVETRAALLTVESKALLLQLAAVIAFALAVVCVLLAKAKLTGRLYPETRAELKRDQQWLRSLGKTGPQ